MSGAIPALRVIGAANTVDTSLGNVLVSFRAAADDSFARRAPAYGFDYVGQTIERLTLAAKHMRTLADEIPGTGYGQEIPLRSAQSGVHELGAMASAFESGAVPFNFASRIDEMRRSASSTISNTVGAALREA